MYGKYFQYDGQLSSSYNLIIGGLDQNDFVFGLEREVIRGDFNRYRNRARHMGTKWSQPLTFNISFIKDTCSESSQKNLVFTEEEVNDINTWLTSPDYPTLFHMYDYDFERDSLNNMILIDSPEASASLYIVAEGYKPATFILEGNHCRVVTQETNESPDDQDDQTDDDQTDNNDQTDNDQTDDDQSDQDDQSEDPTPEPEPEPEPELLTPPKPKVEWLDGYYSIQFYTEEYPAHIISIAKNGEQCNKIETKEWLTMYRNEPIPDYVMDNGNLMIYPTASVYPGDSFGENCYTILINKVKILNVKYDYFGLFTDITPQSIGGDVIGFNATFTTDSPFAWTYEVVQHVDIADAARIDFNVRSAERYRELYPVIEVHIPDDGDDSDERKTLVIDCINDDLSLKLRLMKGATTTIDCSKCMISYVLDSDVRQEVVLDSINDIFIGVGSVSSAYIDGGTIFFNNNMIPSTDEYQYDSPDDIDWGDASAGDMALSGSLLTIQLFEGSEYRDSDDPEELFDTHFIYWPRIFNGPNTFLINGECSFTMTYREPRKVGDW